MLQLHLIMVYQSLENYILLILLVIFKFLKYILIFSNNFNFIYIIILLYYTLGSERMDKSGVTGQAMKETQHINKSLSSLGDVMEGLDKKSKHIPYRNSKLTYLLQVRF